MAKGNMLLGMARKKVGDLVFYRANGEQITRARNRNPRNPKSDKQSVQRMVLASASKLASILEPIVNHSWEHVQVGGASVRHFQKKAMDFIRAAAAAQINGEASVPIAQFTIKGAPAAGIAEGLPISSGSLSVITPVAAGDYENAPVVQGFASSGATIQEILGTSGFQPGDQMTIVGFYAGNTVASASNGATNIAVNCRYARFTFKTELEAGSYDLIGGDTINPDLLESYEGAANFAFAEAESASINGLSIVGEEANGTLFAVAVIRSRKESNGKFLYSPAFITMCDNAAELIGDGGDASLIYQTYMDGSVTIEVGDELYLRNAVASPIRNVAPAPASPYEVSPAMPFQTTANSTFLVTKRDGTNFTTEEVEGLKFTINGTEVSSSPSGSIAWTLGASTVLAVERTTWSSSVEVIMENSGFTISAVE